MQYLYTQLPMYQRQGGTAYKPGLDTVLSLARAFGNPQEKFKSIHIAGTNGKGSTAHTLAAVLQSSGYKAGLFTSPHLRDFRERIRVGGKMIDPESVCRFVERYKGMNLGCSPSFFELTTVMAFEYFAKEKVDIAVIEVGLGGRLDSTNIITPLMGIITNISFDHMALLGNTLAAIASEKAGIIKPGIPVVVGEAAGEVKRVFCEKAAAMNSPILFADERPRFSRVERTAEGLIYHETPYGELFGELSGDCQRKNTATILTALEQLSALGIKVSPEAVKEGFAKVCSLTGLAGRWMTLRSNPAVICDTGHNEGGWQYLSRQLSGIGKGLHLVIGFVSDKEISPILEMMPRGAKYYFTAADIPRAMDAGKLRKAAMGKGLSGEKYDSVPQAYHAALEAAKAEDTIFVGGSTFVVADLLNCPEFNLGQ